tara:strand:+ start:189 stop:398 length:210 start_codon:yes stop_codon:yes gene_type:complete
VLENGFEDRRLNLTGLQEAIHKNIIRRIKWANAKKLNLRFNDQRQVMMCEISFLICKIYLKIFTKQNAP